VVAAVSRESIRQILHAAGISWQAGKTWKASTDPDFIAKMRRVLDLYDHPPADGRVICADEFGPLNLPPRPGRGWRPARHPVRLRASYRRTSGVRHMIAALDLATGQVFDRIRARKRRREYLAFLKLLRQRWPAGRLYVIADNFSPHKHPEVTGWAAVHDVDLVFLPTYSSWLNWIEPEFAALRYFTLNGTDHRTHAEQGDAIARYLRWRNARANQVELVVHCGHQGSILRPVAARHPSIRWGRYWIFLSLRLMMRTRPAWSAAAKLAMDRLSSDQMPSAGFMSGAYAGSW